jgi:hypothetical protein
MVGVLLVGFCTETREMVDFAHSGAPVVDGSRCALEMGLGRRVLGLEIEDGRGIPKMLFSVRVQD